MASPSKAGAALTALREDLTGDVFAPDDPGYAEARTVFNAMIDRRPAAIAPCVDEARKLFEKLLSLRNDLGLLAEEWDPRQKRQVGNFPQAFSHVPLIDTALRLTASGAYGG